MEETSEKIRHFIKELLSSGQIKPDDQNSFKESLFKVLLENDKSSLNQAYDEINLEEGEILKRKLESFQNELSEPVDEIKDFLIKNNEASNDELKKCLFEARNSGCIAPALECIKRLARKKVKLFDDIVRQYEKKPVETSTIKSVEGHQNDCCVEVGAVKWRHGNLS